MSAADDQCCPTMISKILFKFALEGLFVCPIRIEGPSLHNFANSSRRAVNYLQNCEASTDALNKNM